MSGFKKEDVIILAKAIAEMGYYESNYDCEREGRCHMCCGDPIDLYNFSEKDFKHELDCPTLVANDVLVGHE